jgi:hypothetical protein
VIYERNAGYKGKVHGDTKLRNPAPKAKNIFKSVPIYFPPYFFLYQS